jgi:hypothetical protein
MKRKQRPAERQWTAPPGWPVPPPGWSPPPDWRPDPDWPPPPTDWEWWQQPNDQARRGAWYRPYGEGVEPSGEAPGASDSEDHPTAPDGWPAKAVSLFPRIAAELDAAETHTANGSYLLAEERIAAAVALKAEAGLASRGKVEAAVRREAAARRDRGSLADPIAWRLELAAEHAQAGDIVAEEAAILDAGRAAERENAGDKRKARKQVSSAIEELVKDGRLRRGARHLGTVSRHLGSGTGSLLIAALDKKDLEVYSDRLLHDGKAYALDGRVSVSLEVDGQVVTSSRPTMTRMAAGAVLPGTALIPGLAFQKKTSTDTRSALLIVAHPDWSVTVAVDPDVGSIRTVVAKLQTAVRELERLEAANASTSTPAPLGEDALSTKLSKLERVASLQASGALSAEEAQRLCSDILAAE